MSEVAAAVVGAVAEVSAAHLLDWRRDEKTDARALRRHHGDAMLPPLVRLRRLLTRAEIERDPATWVEAVTSCVDVLEAAETVLPLELRRVKRSMRDAVGTATNMGLVDLLPGWEPELTPFDRIWSQYAEEYLGLMIYRLQEWRNTWNNRRAGRIRLPTFNTWLLESGRHRPGEILDGSQPEPLCSCG